MLRISAKVDYAVRALCRLAGPPARTMKAHQLAELEAIPARFLAATLADLRRNGLVESKRGGDGGFRLARPAEEITIADVIVAIDGGLVDVRARSDLGSPTAPVWVMLTRTVTRALGSVTVAEVAEHSSPATG